MARPPEWTFRCADNGLRAARISVRIRCTSGQVAAVAPRLVVMEKERTLQRLLTRYLPEVEVTQTRDIEEAVRELNRSPAQALVVNASPLEAIPPSALTGLPYGTLKRIDQSAREIHVQPDNAALTVFAIADDCEITRDDKKADFIELREGDILDIWFEPQADGPAVTRTIDARHQK